MNSADENRRKMNSADDKTRKVKSADERQCGGGTPTGIQIRFPNADSAPSSHISVSLYTRSTFP